MSRSIACRILRPDEWERARAAGELLPTPLDLKDGFLHLSPRSEVLETAARYFTDSTKLILLRFSTEELKPHLRWEAVPSRNGQLFPHYYGRLSLQMSFQVSRLTRSTLTAPWEITEVTKENPEFSP
jgi:uncharacterized protein (DUF952 family)